MFENRCFIHPQMILFVQTINQNKVNVSTAWPLEQVDQAETFLAVLNICGPPKSFFVSIYSGCGPGFAGDHLWLDQPRANSRDTCKCKGVGVGPTFDKKNHSCHFHCSLVHPIFTIASVLVLLLDPNHHQCDILVLVLLFCLFVLCVWTFVKSRAGRRAGRRAVARRQSGPHVSNTMCSSAAQ